MSKVRISRHKATPFAECLNCGDRLHRDANRERVREHVLQTGHIARFVVPDITTYQPPEEH